MKDTSVNARGRKQVRDKEAYLEWTDISCELVLEDANTKVEGSTQRSGVSFLHLDFFFINFYLSKKKTILGIHQ